MAGKQADPYAEEIASAKRLLEEKAYDDQSWSDWAGDAAENAIRTARSILPTALGGEGEVGISDIARGAYEAGKDAVTFPGDVITGKQALFDETGRPLESAVGRSFNAASTIGGASSVVPAPDNSLRVFGGVKSLTADKPAIRDAMKMESKGASPDEIWDNTGWFRGADGRWRYEIPDIGTTVNSGALQLDLSAPTILPAKAAKLGDYLQHPRFFAAYPQFKNMDVRTMPGSSSYGGMYYPRFAPSWGAVSDPRIELNENLLSSGAYQRSVLLHEIQHAIQNKEGFAPGTNIQAQSAGRVKPAVKRYEEAVKNDPEMRELMSLRSSMDFKKQQNEANDLHTAEYVPRYKEIDASSMSDREKEAAYNALNKEYNERIENMFPMLGQVENLRKSVSSRNIPLYALTHKMLTPTEAYQRYAGETEARNVQSRMDWKEENLRGIRPWETQDHPYIDQLFPENDVTWKLGYASGGEVNDDDIDDAIRIAKDVGGSASTPVLMEDAKGNKYDAQGNIIPPTNPGPNPARSDATPQSVASKAVNDPATYDALMERYAIPDRDIAEYEALRETVGKQPQDIQQMTHVGDRPRREMTIDMPLFGGEYSMGTAPYDVAEGLQGMAQTAYDFKTMPAYLFPPTAPFALGADVLESRLADDPLGFALNAALTPQGASAAKSVGRSALDLVRRNPKATAAAVGTGAYLSPDEAEAGPERWFSKAMEVARAIPMEKMTGQQALAMLRKGVSPEELKWTGADAFLPQQKQITKQDLVDYLGMNRVQLNEINLGGERPSSLNDILVADIPDEIKAKHMPEINRANEEMTKLSLSLDKMRRSPDQSNSAYEAFTEISRKYTQAQMELGRIKLAMKQEYVDSIGGLSRPVKFGPGSGYGETLTTPGGKSYRENLFAIPARDIFTPFVEQMRKDVWSENYKEALSNGFSEERAKAFAEKFNNLKPGELAKFLGKEEELASIFEAQRSLKEAEYTGGHWSEYPGVIAHTRTNELMYEPPGANRPYRVHNVEETQSDPGQAGRKSGFKDPQAMAAVAKLRQEEARLRAELKSEQARLYKEHQERIAPHTEERVRYERELREKYKRGEISLGDMNRAAEEYPSPEQELTGQYRAATYETLNPIMDKIAATEAEINRIGSKIGSIPMMPYVTSTEGWTDFAIKKELDRAFDSGSDYFSWTPGEVHADRYGLEKHLSKIEYNPDDGSLIAYDPKGKMVVNESVNNPDDLDEYIGKELADKMRLEAESRRSVIDEYEIAKDEETGEWNVYLYGGPSSEAFSSKRDARDYLNELVANDLAQNPVQLSGLDLKVGGEGMRGYYDKIYLKRVQDVIKKSTGIKPEIETITVNAADGPRQQLGVRITDEMREKARFSDFNKGGRVSDPVVNKALSLTRY